MKQRRRPTSAQAKQNISRALKGKKRQMGTAAQKAIQKRTGLKFVNEKAFQRKKKAAKAVGIAGGLAGGAVALNALRKRKAGKVDIMMVEKDQLRLGKGPRKLLTAGK